MLIQDNNKGNFNRMTWKKHAKENNDTIKTTAIINVFTGLNSSNQR